MSRAVRTILVVVGILVVLVLAAPFLIPVNQFRPIIEGKASAALGRKVELGNLSLSLISGSLAAENLSIGDDPKFSSSPFLTAKSLKVGVELVPLVLSRTLNVTGITIENPEVTLLRNPAGQWNYSSLGSAAAKAQSKSKSTASTSSVPELTVKKLELKDGRMTVGSTSSKKRSTYEHVSVTASDFSMTSKFPVTLTAQLPEGGGLKLDGNVGPIDESDADLTPLDAKLNVSSLNLASTGFLDPSMGLGGLLDLAATVASHNGEAETKGDAKLSKALFVAGGSPATVPVNVNFNTKYNLRKNAGVLNPSTLKIGSAAAHLSGTYQTPADETILNVKIQGENMPARDLEAFLPALGVHLPKGASLAAGTLSANLNVSGPTDKLVTTGNVGLFSAKLANFDLGAKMAAISALTGLKTGKDLEIEKLTTNLRMAPDGLKADNFNAVIPTLGGLIGVGTIDAKNNLDFKMVATLAAPQGGGTTGAGGPAGGIGGLLGQITGGGGAAGAKGMRVPFLIQGTTSDPKFIPDVAGIAAEMFKSQLKGLTAPAGTQQQQNNPIDALSGLLKKKP